MPDTQIFKSRLEIFHDCRGRQSCKIFVRTTICKHQHWPVLGSGPRLDMCKFGLSLSNVWRTKYSPNQNSYTRRCPDKKVIFFLSTPDIMVVWEGPDNHKSLILSEKWGKVSPWLLMIFLRLPSKGGEVPLPNWFEYMNKTCSRLMNSPYSYIDQHPCDEILYLTIKKKRCKSPFKHSMMLLQPRAGRCKNSIWLL